MFTHFQLVIFTLLMTFAIGKGQLKTESAGKSAFSVAGSIGLLKTSHTLFNLNLGTKKPIRLNHIPQKLPVFCRIEAKFRNKFNVFLKIRAGNDEDYRKMIKL